MTPRRPRLRWADWPWAAKLALLLGTLAIVPLTVVALAFATAARSEQIAAVREQSLRQAKNTAHTIDDYLQGVRADVQVVAQAPGTVRFLAGDRGPGLAADVRLGLRQMRDTHAFEAVYLTGRDGTVRLATEERFLGRSYVAARWFLNAMAGNATLDPPRYDPEDKRVYLHVSAPVRKPDGRIVGTAVGRIRMEGIDRIVRGDTGFAGRGELGVLWDADGIRLSHPNRPDQRFRPFERLAPDLLARLAAEQRFGPGTAQLLGTGTAPPGLVERSRWLLYDRDADPHLRLGSGDEAWYVAITPLTTSRWLYGVFTPESAILARLAEQARRNLLIAALTAALAAGVAFLTARRVTRRLEQQVAEQTAALRDSEEALRALYDREQDLRVRAEEANRIKDEFLSTVSHELRTPLNAILGWTWLLAGGKLDAEATARALATIERNARSQSQIIDDLLDVSRIITGKLRLHVAEVDLIQIVEAALDSIRPAADAKEIRIERRLDPTAARAGGDAQRLQQVVWNLLANAVKFTPRGGRVEVCLARVDSQIEIRVSDTGVGVSGDFLGYVFDRFRQADSSTTRTHGGLGLGLAIVRHLVELHGGTVAAASEGEGRGATFTVRLPLPAVLRPAPEPQTTPAPRPEPAEPETAGELQGMRILLVDDEVDARDVLGTIFTELGAAVTATASTREALAALRSTSFDLLVADIGMPEEDGYALIRQVRSLGGDVRGLPAIALTAYAGEADRKRALDAGFQLHLAKPVAPHDLAAAAAAVTGVVR